MTRSLSWLVFAYGVMFSSAAQGFDMMASAQIEVVASLIQIVLVPAPVHGRDSD